MSYLSMVEAKLPPGFRFHPRDDELICDYLNPKVLSSSGDAGATVNFPAMVDVDLNKCEPWDLPAQHHGDCHLDYTYYKVDGYGIKKLMEAFDRGSQLNIVYDVACVGGKEWYFFNLRDRKYATGQRTNRATMSGYWKATGKDRQIIRKGTVVGMRKTLVFYQGRAPKGKKTDWVMHEFRIEGRGDLPPMCYGKEDWVLCRVFYKSRGIGTPSKAPTRIENSYDDTGSSSLPPLSEPYITFDQTLTPPPPPPPPINSHDNNLSSDTTSFEQVPCFSIYPHITTTTTPQHFINTIALVERNKPSSCLTQSVPSSSIWYPFQS